jgi:hypothetical protein
MTTKREGRMEHARTLEPVLAGDESPLARARLHLQLTVDEAARRANISPEEVQWLEEGRLYRFPTPDHAVLSTMLYATGLGLAHRDALELAGLPLPPKPLGPWRRLGAVAAVGALVLAATLAIVLAQSGAKPKPSTAASAAATLPAPWAIKVVVLNGSGDKIAHVGKATSFTYLQTEVYYPPGGEAIGLRLAKQLGVPAQPLPGGLDPRRLVVIVGPERGPGN